MKQDRRAVNWNSKPVLECINIGWEVDFYLHFLQYKWQAYRKVAKKHHIEELTAGNYHKMYLAYLVGLGRRELAMLEVTKCP